MLCGCLGAVFKFRLEPGGASDRVGQFSSDGPVNGFNCCHFPRQCAAFELRDTDSQCAGLFEKNRFHLV